MFALFINAAILILAASAFHWSGHQDVAEIQDAYQAAQPDCSACGIASTLFAVALLASGQNSTLTGTLAGQIVMEGFLNFRIAPWLRRLITRGIAIVPAVLVIGFYGEGKTTRIARRQPGGAEHATRFRGLAADAVHRREGEDGRIRQSALDQDPRLDRGTIIIVLNVKLLFDTFMPEAARRAFYGFLGLPAE